MGHELIADQADVAQVVLRFGDDLLPVGAVGVARVDGDQPAARRLVVGLEVEDRAVVADEVVLVIEVLDPNCADLGILTAILAARGGVSVRNDFAEPN